MHVWAGTHVTAKKERKKKGSRRSVVTDAATKRELQQGLAEREKRHSKKAEERKNGKEKRPVASYFILTKERKLSSLTCR